MAERVVSLLESLRELDEQYRLSVIQVVYAKLGTTLPSCQGTCLRVLYPRKQWEKLPVEFRKALGKWIAEAGSYVHCTPCYRAAVRDGKLQTVRKNNTKILSDEELLQLRKQVGLIK